MKKIGLREFLHNASKMLKEDTFILTKHGRDIYRVSIEKIDGNNEKPVEAKVVTFVQSNIIKREVKNTYACGCLKAGSKLCSKHGVC